MLGSTKDERTSVEPDHDLLEGGVVPRHAPLGKHVHVEAVLGPGYYGRIV